MHIKRTVNAVIVNLILLAAIFLILGFAIPFYPQVLDVLVGALLIVGGIICLNIAFHIYVYKKKYAKWL